MISSTLSELLARIGNELSLKLLNHYYDLSSEEKKKLSVTHLDIVDANTLSFLPKGREVLGDKYNSPQRQTAKVGKVFKKYLKDVDENELRELVEKYNIVLREDKYEIKVLESDKIEEIYSIKVEDCSEYTVKSTPLYGACFQGKLKPDQFTLFKEYPDIFKILTIWIDGKLDARSLLIKCDDGDTVMENRYYGSMGGYYVLEKFSKDNGYWFPNMNKGGWIKGSLKLRYSELVKTVTFPKMFTTFQYFDTFRIDGNALKLGIKYGR